MFCMTPEGGACEIGGGIFIHQGRMMHGFLILLAGSGHPIYNAVMMDAVQMAEFLRTLADPVRLAILQSLLEGGAAVSELVARLAVSQPNVSNHLAILRKRGLVQATKLGRQMVYEVASPLAAEVVETLARAAGRAPRATRALPALVAARTCDDHLAGTLGVTIFDALVKRRALRSVPNGGKERKVRAGLGEVSLGPQAEAVFSAFGVDLATTQAEKRQFATACLDWTENRPHLGGALGAALCSRVIERGWILRRPGSRALLLTGPGRRALSRFGIHFDLPPELP